MTQHQMHRTSNVPYKSSSGLISKLLAGYIGTWYLLAEDHWVFENRKLTAYLHWFFDHYQVLDKHQTLDYARSQPLPLFSIFRYK